MCYVTVVSKFKLQINSSDNSALTLLTKTGALADTFHT